MTSLWPQLDFLNPVWLCALVILPAIVFFCSISLVDLPRRQMIASTAIRSAIIVLIVLSLAGLTSITTTQDVFVVFVVDDSLSVGDEGRQLATEFVDEATQSKAPETFAVLPFATLPGNFLRNSDRLFVGHTASSEWRTGTNLRAALDIAKSGVPAEHVPHILLLSDGNETRGDVRAAVGSPGVRISTVPLPARSEPEIQVSELIVPSQVSDNSPFDVEVVVDSNHVDRATVELFLGDYKVESQPVQLATGENRFLFSQQVDRPSQFTASVVRSDNATAVDSTEFQDTLLDNNSASGVVHTSGKPRVLLIDRTPEAAQSLQRALTGEGIQVDVRPPQALPNTLADLQDYHAVILSNVPADALSAKQMEVLRSFVQETGGGFLMLGGDESFGLGGYYKTTIEDVLPVRSDFEKEKEKPGIAMILVIDKSSSMGGNKLELAKDAARGTVELLGDKDQIGVIAFDGAPHWVSELRSAAQKSTVIDRIAAIELGGGTTLYPAMQEAFRALQAATAKLKHVIILTDGYSTPGDFEGIAQDMAALRITVSTVGLGEVDEPLLRRIAEIGSGRTYFCSDAASIPQIFARETVTASKSAINEEPFLPLLVRATPVLDGVDFDEAPFLLGYVVTQPKATSEVILVHPETQDPLLSWWRYGLGMSVAFTSDARNRWAADWLSWDGYQKFWVQTVRHCLRKADNEDLTMSLTRKDDRCRVTVESVDATGQFRNDALTRLTIVDPQLKSQSLELTQTAPGRYATEFEMTELGAWNFQVTQTVDNETVAQQTRGMVVGYADELRLRSTNVDLLQTIADQTGGTLNPAASDVFTPLPTESAPRTNALWPWLLSLASLLFVADVALRRIEFPSVFGRTMHRESFRSS